jgi:hypothetical protein
MSEDAAVGLVLGVVCINYFINNYQPLSFDWDDSVSLLIAN